jgi:hypothetical protein
MDIISPKQASYSLEEGGQASFGECRKAAFRPTVLFPNSQVTTVCVIILMVVAWILLPALTVRK